MNEVLQQFKQQYLVKYWNPVIAVIAAGLISAYYFGVTGTYWAVTGEFTRWGGHALQTLGVDVSNWSYYKIIGMQGTIFTRVDGVMILGMFAGCISAALWANNVKWRNQPHKRRIVQALIGGALAGFGARLAMGCNLASLFTGIPQFSVHAWFFTIATAIGTYVAQLVLSKLPAPEKTSFQSRRTGFLSPFSLSTEDRNALIREQPAYGNLICRCESVTEGEILDAIHRTPGARSLDGVKRRTRAGMGRCQAGFCSPKVMDILQRELQLEMEEVTKSGEGSPLVVGRTKQ